MGMTSFYMGSLRYSPTGKKRKKHFANSTKRKPVEFKSAEVKKTTLDKLREQQAKQYKSLMEEAVKNGTFTKLDDSCMRRKESPKYTGDLIQGIATMHKSNAVPVMKGTDQAKDIARMRRG